MNQSTVDIVSFRRALGTFLTGVTIVTTLDEKQRALGFTANSFSSVSLDPPLVLVCMSKASCNFDVYLNAPAFAINILTEHQRDISTTFASPSEDRFAHIDWRSGVTGSPILYQVAAWFDCKAHQVIDAGDHIILLGRVLDYEHNAAPPLGYLRGNYVHFALEQTAVAAIENPQQQTCVGAIIEHEKSLFLMPDGKHGLKLPQADRLGNEQERNSLSGLLESLNLSSKTNYLFAVFENKQTQTSNIYYRGEVDHTINSELGDFYPFAEIPFDRISDEAVQIMLKRYIHERALNAFGIYVGDEYSGVIELLRNQ